MIIDTSAVVAILRSEPEYDSLVRVLASTPRTSRRMSAATFLEASIVMDRSRDPVHGRGFDRLLARESVEIVSVTESQVRLARAAYRDFGKGSGHRARLNFGDCFSYALAVERDEPLLYKGDDFGHTDVRSALDRADGD